MVSMNGEEETVISEAISAIAASLILHSFFIFLCLFVLCLDVARRPLCNFFVFVVVYFMMQATV